MSGQAVGIDGPSFYRGLKTLNMKKHLHSPTSHHASSSSFHTAVPASQTVPSHLCLHDVYPEPGLQAQGNQIMTQCREKEKTNPCLYILNFHVQKLAIYPCHQCLTTEQPKGSNPNSSRTNINVWEAHAQNSVQ